ARPAVQESGCAWVEPPTCPSCSVRLLHRDLDHIKAILDEPRSRRAQISRFDLRKSNGVSDCLSAARRVVNPEASCMIVSSQLFEAYLECSTKCWLRSRAEPATGNVYAEWARLQNETYLEVGVHA